MEVIISRDSKILLNADRKMPFVNDMNFSLSITKVVELNGVKHQFKAFQIYPFNKAYKTENGWKIEINNSSFEVEDDDIEIYPREEPDEYRKKIKNLGGTIPDQNQEYMNKYGRDLSMDIIENIIDSFYGEPSNKFSDKVQKFLNNKAHELQKYFVDGKFKNMNPKVIFDHFVNAGGILIEDENGEIQAIPFWQQRSILPENYYRSLGLKLEIENPHTTNPEGKFVPQKFKWAKFGKFAFKVFCK